MAETWDISAFWRDVDEGCLSGWGSEDLHATTMDRDFIVAYAEKILGLSQDASASRESMSLLIRLDLQRAVTLPAEALRSPILLLNVGRDAGMLKLNDDPHPKHVLADGNHRIARAYLDGITSVPALIAGSELSTRYLVDSPALRQKRRAGQPHASWAALNTALGTSR